jgi:hypothetical protein
MGHADANRDLLVGLLALQNGLIDQVQLVAAFQAWTRDRARPLADHLVARGDLDPDDRSAVAALVDRHLKKHGGDPEKSLAALPAGRSTVTMLAGLGDQGVKESLARVGSSPLPDEDGRSGHTMTLSVGTTTSGGKRVRVLRPHARGGLGAVFVALDAELHREMALKQILDRHADDPTSRQRFLVEAEITGGLEHPGIVPVYGLGAYGDGGLVDGDPSEVHELGVGIAAARVPRLGVLDDVPADAEVAGHVDDGQAPCQSQGVPLERPGVAPSRGGEGDLYRTDHPAGVSDHARDRQGHDRRRLADGQGPEPALDPPLAARPPTHTPGRATSCRPGRR